MGGFKEWVDWWMNGWAEGEGKDGFSSLMKQNKKGKKCAVFCFASLLEKEKYYFIYYAVITWEKFHKRPANHYSQTPHPPPRGPWLAYPLRCRGY